MAIQKRTTAKGKIRWVARYRDLTGKEHSKSFDRERDAKDWIEDQRSSIRRGTWIDPADSSVTVGELVDEYISLTSHKGTREDRESLQSNLGDLKDVPLSKLRASHIKNWAIQLRDGRPWKNNKKLSASTVKVKAGQLRGVLNRAHEDGLLPRPLGNTLKGFDVGEETDFYVPLAKEIEALYEYATGWFRLALRLGAEAGLRASEACGLRVMDVDFIRRVIRVRVQAERGSGENVVPLKSEESRRDIPISEDLALDLSTALIGRDAAPEDRLLLSARGCNLYAKRITGEMDKARKATGVDKRIHFHSLRHLFASRLLATGSPLPVASMLMGHANVNVTAQVYSHYLPEQDDAARAAIDALAGFLRDGDKGNDESEELNSV